jgi:hypothetical protein
MRLLIDTRDIKFRVAGLPQPRKDFQDKDKQATTPPSDGSRPIWVIRLDAVDDQRKTKETIFVEVAGDEPRLTFDGPAVVHELVYAPWIDKRGDKPKIARAFRAASIADAVPSGKSVQAVA